ncbi:hypothetical protein [Rickettsia endosymbiont of Halotydeus destructor]|uniref:hypothetical protein n=1 Tax=Rickettsia endosymbiont of Halotydeus destructor TaxID=2996754 RepID=UPI003BAE1E16
MTKIFKFIIMGLFFISNLSYAENISEAAKKNLQIINSLKVEEKWQKGEIINCKTGEIIEQYTGEHKKTGSRLTHDGCFVYAVLSSLNISKNSLPPHPELDTGFIPLLANKQADWYETEGNKCGWSYIKNKDREDNFIQAQKLANQGYLVVATYKNINPKRAGHTAIVIPSDKDIEKIKKDGPDIAQAGTYNSSCSSLKKGFRNKKDVFKNNEIKFYYYKN